MHKIESVLENETHKILRDFEIQMDHLIPARSLDLEIILKKKEEKKICRFVDFVFPVDHKVKIKVSEDINKYLNLAKEQKKMWNMQVMVIPIVVGALGTALKGLEREIGRVKNQKKIQDHSVPNRSLYQHVLECVNWCVAISQVEVGPVVISS